MGSTTISDPHTERELTLGQEVLFRVAGRRLGAHPRCAVEVTLVQYWPSEKGPASPATASWARTGAKGPTGPLREAGSSQGAHCARPPVASQSSLPLPGSALAFSKSF